VVPTVGDVEIAIGRRGDVVHPVKCRVLRGPVVTGVSLAAISSDGRQSAVGVSLVDPSTGQFHDVHVALFVEVHAKRRIEQTCFGVLDLRE